MLKHFSKQLLQTTRHNLLKLHFSSETPNELLGSLVNPIHLWRRQCQRLPHIICCAGSTSFLFLDINVACPWRSSLLIQDHPRVLCYKLGSSYRLFEELVDVHGPSFLFEEVTAMLTKT